IPQLIRAAMIQGLSARFFRWAYQAKVMNTLLQISSTMVISVGCIQGRRQEWCALYMPAVQGAQAGSEGAFFFLGSAGFVPQSQAVAVGGDNEIRQLVDGGEFVQHGHRNIQFQLLAQAEFEF